METALKTLEERYEIGEALGRKGSSQVFSGHDRTIGREVSILRIEAEDRDGEPVSTRDIVEDAIAIASIQHSNFVAVYDFGTDENGPYVVTERLQGVILERTLKSEPLGPEDFIELVRQTLEALIAAHASDLGPVCVEPWNVLLVRQPGTPFVAKILGLGRDHGSREEGSSCAEFLALGRLYYEALTGVRPFVETTTASLSGSKALERLQPCSDLNDDVPEELSDWITWLIREADADPEVTPVSLLDDFLGFLGEKRRSAGIGHAGEGHEEGFSQLMDALDPTRGEDAEPERERGANEFGSEETERIDREDEDLDLDRAQPSRGDSFDPYGEDDVRGLVSPFHFPDLEGETEAVPSPDFQGVSGSRVPSEGLMLSADDLAFLSEAAEKLSAHSKEAAQQEEISPETLGADVPGLEQDTDLTGLAGIGEEEVFGKIDVIAPAERELSITGDGELDEVAPATDGEAEAEAESEKDVLECGDEFEAARRPRMVFTVALAIGVIACVLVIGFVNYFAGGGIAPALDTEEAPPIPEGGQVNAPSNFGENTAIPAVQSGGAASATLAGEDGKEVAFSERGGNATPEVAAVASLAMMPTVDFDSAKAGGLTGASPSGELEELLARAKEAEVQGDDLSAFSDYLEAVEQYPRSESAREALVAFVELIGSRPPDVVDFLEDKLVRSSEYGVAAAMRILGERSYGLEQWESAIEWFRKAALENDVRSRVFLGLLLVQGKGAALDLEEAAANFEWAAKRGDQNALYLAGECYVLGRGVPRNAERAGRTWRPRRRWAIFARLI